MERNTCDVLILTASFGNGHNSATNALIEKIESLFPDMSVVSEDLFSITTPKLKEYLFETYNLLTRSKLPLYNGLYHLRNTKENVVDELMLKLYYKRFEKYVQNLKPKMIISVFPTCAQFVSNYKEKTDASIKSVTVITDVVAGWEWINESTDMYCVPAQDVKNALIEKGISSRQVFITGVPVMEAFDSDHEGVRSIKNVLMMSSAMGKLSFTQKTIETLGELPYQFTVVTGKNVELFRKLSAMKIPENIHVIGYTQNIAQIMKQSDLIITKPGGATIFEAIESNLPMLIQPSKVGQEVFNIEFINKYGFGETFKNQSEMISKMDLMLNDDAQFNSIISKMNDFKTNTQRDEAFIQIGKWMNQSKVGVN
ncbi:MULTISPECIES: glycosyltransferase [unclassified Fusibacter]|uniref:MGDG synthase family glycosyltransferase n=1 Tax=unclassified Fusibacter TaxID=2624464 RepID=UPI0013E94CFF|nr:MULTISPECIES: glycosyltransferase [unclassified Fusibacter]MCK8059979.1 hypothetical protein [Fusibacter sp. A2]NPE22119.1 hypothetical protein [Fusibacter sp. A1]